MFLSNAIEFHTIMPSFLSFQIDCDFFWIVRCHIVTHSIACIILFGENIIIYDFPIDVCPLWFTRKKWIDEWLLFYFSLCIRIVFRAMALGMFWNMKMGCDSVCVCFTSDMAKYAPWKSVPKKFSVNREHNITWFLSSSFWITSAQVHEIGIFDGCGVQQFPINSSMSCLW